MLDHQLKQFGIKPEEIEAEVDQAFKKYTPQALNKLYENSIKELKENTIIKGKIVDIITAKEVMIDVGYKAEGSIPISQFPSPQEIKIGDEIEVYLESLEDDAGLIVLSKTKADHTRGWERIMRDCKEGSVVKGRVSRKIKGGLIVDIGVPAFLPASQADIRKLDDLGSLVDKQIEAQVLKVDPERMNIIISRRKHLERQRESDRQKLLSELKEGDIRSGMVKNIADYGVFVDLGGIDGLLHISDMAWKRVSHPSEIVTLDQTLNVKILKIEPTTGRIALGLKQLTSNPWEKVSKKYPVDTRIKGKVTNLMTYGAFVELESGVEGLLHISEISWIKRITHPSEVLAVGDIIECLVLNINTTKQELALGMKQLEVNPWTQLEKKYTPGMRIQGRVRNLTTYGAFIEIEEGIDGLLHISDMAWTKKVANPSELVKKGDKIEAVILSIEPEKKRVSLGLKQLTPNPWETVIPEKYNVGVEVKGKIIRLISTGAYVELEPDIVGFLSLPTASVDKSKPAGAKAKPTVPPGNISPNEVAQETSCQAPDRSSVPEAAVESTSNKAQGAGTGETETTPQEPAQTKAPPDKTETRKASRPKMDEMVIVKVVKLNPPEGYIGLKLAPASGPSQDSIKTPASPGETETSPEKSSSDDTEQQTEAKKPAAEDEPPAH